MKLLAHPVVAARLEPPKLVFLVLHFFLHVSSPPTVSSFPFLRIFRRIPFLKIYSRYPLFDVFSDHPFFSIVLSLRPRLFASHFCNSFMRFFCPAPPFSSSRGPPNRSPQPLVQAFVYHMPIVPVEFSAPPVRHLVETLYSFPLSLKRL